MDPSMSMVCDNLSDQKRVLKRWETSFFAANGRKPTKSDVRAEECVARGYSNYSKLKRRKMVLNDPSLSARQRLAMLAPTRIGSSFHQRNPPSDKLPTHALLQPQHSTNEASPCSPKRVAHEESGGGSTQDYAQLVRSLDGDWLSGEAQCDAEAPCPSGRSCIVSYARGAYVVHRQSSEEEESSNDGEQSMECSEGINAGDDGGGGGGGAIRDDDDDGVIRDDDDDGVIRDDEHENDDDDDDETNGNGVECVRATIRRRVQFALPPLEVEEAQIRDSALWKLRVPQLRSQCSSQSLSTAGLKRHLVRRLVLEANRQKEQLATQRQSIANQRLTELLHHSSVPLRRAGRRWSGRSVVERVVKMEKNHLGVSRATSIDGMAVDEASAQRIISDDGGGDALPAQSSAITCNDDDDDGDAPRGMAQSTAMRLDAASHVSSSMDCADEPLSTTPNLFLRRHRSAAGAFAGVMDGVHARASAREERMGMENARGSKEEAEVGGEGGGDGKADEVWMSIATPSATAGSITPKTSAPARTKRPGASSVSASNKASGRRAKRPRTRTGPQGAAEHHYSGNFVRINLKGGWGARHRGRRGGRGATRKLPGKNKANKPILGHQEYNPYDVDEADAEHTPHPYPQRTAPQMQGSDGDGGGDDGMPAMAPIDVSAAEVPLGHVCAANRSGDASATRSLAGVGRRCPSASRIPPGDEERLLRVLRRSFQLQSFRPGQLRAIWNVCNGVDTLVIVPTGGGKSLVYQMAALLLRAPLVTLVVTPLVSLMQDQLARLPAALGGVALHAGMSAGERADAMDAVGDGRARVLFVSPERLVSDGFLASVQHRRIPPVGLVCIDEIHCLSEWGHNFRTSYLRLPHVLRNRLCHTANAVDGDAADGDAADGGLRRPTILGLTGTATRRTTEHITRALGISNCNGGDGGGGGDGDDGGYVDGGGDDEGGGDVDGGGNDGGGGDVDDDGGDVDADVEDDEGCIDADVDDSGGDVDADVDDDDGYVDADIDDDGGDVDECDGTYAGRVIRCGAVMRENLCCTISADEDRLGALVACLRSERFASARPAIIYATYQRQADGVAAHLRSHHIDAQSYHAGKTHEARNAIANRLSGGALRVVVATVAFGMGIDIPDIAAVIHYAAPKSLEAYVQESGRAGRDGAVAQCHAFALPSDVQRLRSYAHGQSLDVWDVRAMCRWGTGASSMPSTTSKANTSSSTANTSSTSSSTSMPPTTTKTNTSSSTPSSSIAMIGQREGNVSSCPRVRYVGMKEEECEEKFDCSAPVVQTIIAYLEQKGIVRSLSNHFGRKTGALKIWFYSQSMKETHGNRLLRAVLGGASDDSCTYVRVKRGGAHVCDPARLLNESTYLKGCTLRELQGELDRLSGEKVLSYEWEGRGILLRILRTPSEAEMEEIVMDIFEKTKILERSRLHKLMWMERVFTKVAYHTYKEIPQSLLLPSDIPEERRLGPLIEEYFEAEHLDDFSMDNSISSAHLLRSDIRAFLASTGDSIKTGRQCARILHGIGSPKFPSKVWCRSPFWNRCADVPFNAVKDIATEELRRKRGVR